MFAGVLVFDSRTAQFFFRLKQIKLAKYGEVKAEVDTVAGV
jgi:hypothetical protein